MAATAILLLLLAAALWGCWRLRGENAELRRRHEGNIAALTSELEAARFRDSLSQASARALELKASEAERLCGRLSEQLYDMGVRMRDVRSATATEVVVRDTVYFPLPLDRGGGHVRGLLRPVGERNPLPRRRGGLRVLLRQGQRLHGRPRPIPPPLPLPQMAA